MKDFLSIFKGNEIYFITVGIIIVLLIVFLIVFNVAKKKGAKKKSIKDREEINRIIKIKIPNVDDLTVVFANQTSTLVGENGKKTYTYCNYLVAFKEWECYVIPLDFRNGRAYPGDVTKLSLDNVASISIRYMKTNARFFDKNDNLIIEFTVAALNSNQIADNCPFDIDQIDDAQKYFTFIDRFSAEVAKKREV